MNHRQLGRTGVQVSPLCLGAMMFGAWGNPDHDDVDRDHPRARSTPGSTSSTPPTSTRAASRRRSSARRSPAAGATTSCSPPRCTARWATTRTSAATRAAGSSARSRTACGGSKTDWIDLYQIHRPEPGHRHRRDARRADRPRAPGQGPLHRHLDLPAVADRRGAVGGASERGRERFVCEQPPYSMLVRGDRGRRAADLPALRHGRHPVEPARPAAGCRGKWRKGADAPQSTRARAAARPLRPLGPRQPAQARRGRRARASSPTRRACR